MSVIDRNNEAQVDLLMAYRRVFGTEDGKLVLADILTDLHYHDTIANMGDATLHNAAKIILFKLGILQDSNERGMIEAFMKLPYLPPKEGDKEK